ncbi:Hemin transport system permease protein HmuU [Salinivirga cyanobacteriivorans]|uniref:Hemin transport system permease protein HmuU n=1 Tax=Salinivirga cyanobacteriivorans TaxID=1307839 RepID=A0A0S2HXG2_9BACT|nr:iron ABC transporter permease [Salinivirga cyanobacteriivorans]ALO14645.1 Hemin transport system permease protein HmuU [Salinivirga cyanobacteriivorans]
MNQTQKIILISVITVALFIADLLLGSVIIPLPDFWELINDKSSNDFLHTILFNFRFPRALTAVAAGMALSVSGLIMQTVFRNPLAGPFVLGISSGASLGVALIIIGFQTFGWFSRLAVLSNWTVVTAALLGSGLLLLLLLLVSTRVKDIMTILILGILFSSSVSALVSIMQYFSPEGALKSYVIWTMGNLGNVTGGQLQILWLATGAGVLIALLNGKGLNIMLLGEHYAQTTGVNIFVFRLFIFLATSLLAGAVTAFCGPIGFIGIAVPHVVRLVFKSTNHFILIPGTLLAGAAIMLMSDIVAHLPGSDRILPINSITALLGIPIVVWIIFRNRHLSQVF